MSNEQMNEVLRELLLRLESIQRAVGEVQSELIQLLRAEQGPPAAPSGISPAPPTSTVEEVAELEDESAIPPTPAERPTTCLHPTEWLTSRRVTILRQPPPGELDEVFDRLATFLGERFQNVRPFYEAIKRRVGGHTYSRIPTRSD